MFDNIKDFFSKNYGWMIAIVVVGLASFFTGGYLKQNTIVVEEKIKVVEVEKQVVVEKERVRVEIVKVKDTQVIERWRREKTEEKKPDGTVTTKETEEKNIDTVIHEKQNDTIVKVVEVEKQVVVEKERLVETKTNAQPQWHFGVTGGINPQFLPTPAVNSYAVGVEVERRIIGPFFAGAWAMGTSNGQGFGGIKLGAEF